MALRLPIGDFADNSASNDKAGLAKGGGSALINIGYLLYSKNFGISVVMNRGIYDIGDLDDDVRSSPSYASPLWVYEAFMAGPLLSFPSANGRIEFDVRALTGILNAEATGTSRVNFFHWIWVRFRYWGWTQISP